MRRLLPILLSLAVVAGTGAATVAGAGPASAQLPPDDARLGLVYDGLSKAPVDSLCNGAYEALLEREVGSGMKDVVCTHGPDPAPPGVDVRQDRGPDPAAELTAPSAVTAQATGPLPCYGTGSDGYRVQLIYAHGATSADRYSTYAASFASWAGRIDQVVNDSAAETGGTRHVRFVTDTSCNPIVARVTLSSAAMASFSTMVSELHNLGYNRTDRKYLVWSDANVYCGISELYVDDSASTTPGVNYNNGNPYIQGATGRIDNGCWGLQNMVEAHELLHTLGGVQPTAPHATPGYHCTDEYDRLCYADGSTSAPMQYVCPAAHEALYDCNHDDYFSTSPPAGSYLSSHWNTASSAFLSASGAAPVTTTTVPPTTTSTTAPPPTTTTLPPATTTTTAAPPPATTTTAAPPTTATTQPPSAGVPSAPQSLTATQPNVGPGVQLAWQAPSTGPVTGYRIYRGTSPYTLALLSTVGNVAGYTDASAGPTLYYYRVSAYNGSGEGPPSNYAGMIGKTATPAGAVNEVDPRLGISRSQLRSPFAWRFA